MKEGGKEGKKEERDGRGGKGECGRRRKEARKEGMTEE